MIRSAEPTPPPHGGAPVHVVHVLGGTSPGLGQEPPSALACLSLRALADGLVAHGVRVTVHAPPEAGSACPDASSGAAFLPAHARTEPEAVMALRSALTGADLVHAHGLRAAALASLARDLTRRRVPLVVGWHEREPVDGPREGLLRTLERRAARAAAVVLCPTPRQVDRARRRGARDARLSPVTLPVPATPPCGAAESRDKTRAEIGAVDRPLLFSLGRLDARHGYGTVVAASRAWRGLKRPPLAVVAGEGPERAALQRQIVAENLPVTLPGRRDDALDLLRASDLVLLPEGGASAMLLAQEALRAGVPVAGATRRGEGARELVGEAGALTEPGDATALGETVAELLRDPVRLARLRAACAERAAALPTGEERVTHVLAVYDELLGLRR
ncbi:glycosyltransferase family 4 protein [Streptomyces sp. RKND-216]|uniref:glycosyltransferase family 4 protein n=1 Tax=Streptomyces sp. RKND-216 TaxID=2562581 RepID=UPI001FFC1A71|nr:glycosyltransferase family 4 protein [Streptomyces sp. RKND-216]